MIVAVSVSSPGLRARRIPTFIPTTHIETTDSMDQRTESRLLIVAPQPSRSEVSYTIFEGTSEIQRLVVARSISGLHIP